MKKEFGKWVLDVAKYVATAVILATVFSDMQEKSTIFVIGGLCVVSMLVGGLFLLKEPKNKTQNKNK